MTIQIDKGCFLFFQNSIQLLRIQDAYIKSFLPAKARICIRQNQLFPAFLLSLWCKIFDQFCYRISSQTIQGTYSAKESFLQIDFQFFHIKGCITQLSQLFCNRLLRNRLSLCLLRKLSLQADPLRPVRKRKTNPFSRMHIKRKLQRQLLQLCFQFRQLLSTFLMSRFFMGNHIFCRIRT